MKTKIKKNDKKIAIKKNHLDIKMKWNKMLIEKIEKKTWKNIKINKNNNQNKWYQK
jgi:hypothetical protein